MKPKCRLEYGSNFSNFKVFLCIGHPLSLSTRTGLEHMPVQCGQYPSLMKPWQARIIDSSVISAGMELDGPK
ncbi:hypothetical protein TIFTF001_031376 [Ficus carica]|uniref:Uncharacterized protein n=1 Tax=Ficus carica TaxID=3494 RepID=A0AA88DUX9_FICCA|nr:hypothetical protein TIFTF001_031376 [Ficus carica]